MISLALKVQIIGLLLAFAYSDLQIQQSISVQINEEAVGLRSDRLRHTHSLTLVI